MAESRFERLKKVNRKAKQIIDSLSSAPIFSPIDTKIRWLRLDYVLITNADCALKITNFKNIAFESLNGAANHKSFFLESRAKDSWDNVTLEYYGKVMEALNALPKDIQPLVNILNKKVKTNDKNLNKAIEEIQNKFSFLIEEFEKPLKHQLNAESKKYTEYFEEKISEQLKLEKEFKFGNIETQLYEKLKKSGTTIEQTTELKRQCRHKIKYIKDNRKKNRENERIVTESSGHRIKFENFGVLYDYETAEKLAEVFLELHRVKLYETLCLHPNHTPAEELAARLAYRSAQELYKLVLDPDSPKFNPEPDGLTKFNNEVVAHLNKKFGAAKAEHKTDKPSVPDGKQNSSLSGGPTGTRGS